MKAESYLCFEMTVMIKSALGNYMFEYSSEEDIYVNKCWEAVKKLEEILTIKIIALIEILLTALLESLLSKAIINE